MGRGRIRRLTRFPLVAGAALAAVVLVTSVSSAAFPPLLTPTPKPAVTPEPELTPPPTPTPTPQPVPTVDLPVTKTPKPAPKAKPSATPVSTALGDKLPPGLEESFPLEIPNIARTPAHNTVELVRLLSPLTRLGLSLDEVLIEGMGRFPVAGLAYYSDDWLNPRYHPKPHLHQGLDIFADFGTPIRSPDRGVVSQFSNAGAGGIAVWVHAVDGTSYYFAHMLERADGLYVGQRVQIGTVLGYVGDTGNAQGGAPHLHFEVHPGGGAAVPPKPSVDAWLAEAELIAPRWVEARAAQIRGGGDVSIASPSVVARKTKDDIETSMLLTLLDPVGGSVGMLPNFGVASRHSGGLISDRLFSQLVRQRVQGHLFIPSQHLAD